MSENLDVVLIYDGECRFCSACLAWLQKQLQLTALPFQEADLQSFGLLRSECEKSVFVIAQNEKYSGAAAIAFLLNLRGNTFTSRLISKSGRFGQLGYRWLASHRDSLVVRLLTIFLERI